MPGLKRGGRGGSEDQLIRVRLGAREAKFTADLMCVTSSPVGAQTSRLEPAEQPRVEPQIPEMVS